MFREETFYQESKFREKFTLYVIILSVYLTDLTEGWV